MLFTLFPAPEGGLAFNYASNEPEIAEELICRDMFF